MSSRSYETVFQPPESRPFSVRPKCILIWLRLFCRNAGTPPSGDSSDEEDHAHEALMETQTTPVDNEDTTYRLVDRDVIEPNGVGLNFVSQPQPNFVSVRVSPLQLLR